MPLFETMLVLLVIAALLLQVSRRLALPYPSMLALAGGVVAALPGVPVVDMEPHLALVLFVAPALLDSAFDTSPRALRRNWLPLLALVVVAVLLTTAAVAGVAIALAGLPLAAAVTLGAIVAPPDAVAAAAVMQQYRLPRRTSTIINGEGLLNDAVALLLFGVGVGAAMSPGASLTGELPSLLVAVPGGALFGLLAGQAYIRIWPGFAGTLSSTIVEFVATFGTWILADRLHLSPIIAVVAYAMTIAKHLPSRIRPRDRIHSYSVWNAAVFVLNVLAFLVMGLQARTILRALSGPTLWRALGFAAAVLVTVVLTRLAWVGFYGWLTRRLAARGVKVTAAPRRLGLLVGWSGMRGLITMATANALPAGFPARDLIVLSAFAVVLGTLVVQGLTIGPLIRWLKIAPDDTLEREVSGARIAMVDAALACLAEEHGPAVDDVRREYEAARATAGDVGRPQARTDYDALRRRAIAAERGVLHALRERGEIDDDAYHRLEEELDWDELSAAPAEKLRILNV